MIQTNSDLRERLLSGPDAYCKDWLSEDDKLVSPIPADMETDASIGRRLTAGCRAAGATYIHVASLDNDRSNDSLTGHALSPQGLESELTGLHFPCLIAPSNFAGALLFPEPGYALLAGDQRFLSGVLPEGVDKARAQFSRYAQRVAGSRPQVEEIAREFTPREAAWRSPKDVGTHTSTALQISLLRSLVTGEVSGPQFAQEWLEARRAAMNAGERVIDPLASLLDEVFATLEDYSIDPNLWEPGDLTDSDLTARIQDLLHRIESA